MLKAEAGVTLEEAGDSSRIRYWPNPGKMARSKELSPERKEFLGYLNDWFYHEFSQDAHLSLTGLLRRGVFFIVGDRDNDAIKLNLLRSRYVAMTVVLLLVILQYLSDSSSSEYSPEWSSSREPILKA